MAEEKKYKYISYEPKRGEYRVRIRRNGKLLFNRRCETEMEAVKERNAFLSGIGMGIPADSNPWSTDKVGDKTLGEVLPLWFEKRKRPFLKEGGVAQYMVKINWWLQVLGRFYVRDISYDIVQACVLNSCETRSVATVRNYVSALGAFFTNVGLPNPCAGIQYPVQPMPEKKAAFTDREAKQVLHYVKQEMDYWYFLLFTLYFESGMRLGEGLAFTWGDVDFDAGRIHIHRTVVYSKDAGGYVVQDMPKTAAGDRLVAISPKFKFQLYMMYQRLKKQTDRDLENVPVFANPENGYRPRSPMWLTNKFSDVLWRLGLKRKRNLTLHSARHMMATKMVKAGVSIPTIMKAGGWKRASTLLEVYAESSQEETDKALRDNSLTDSKKRKKVKVEDTQPSLVLLAGKKDDGLSQQKKRVF
ncbi:site-specific integrase [Selenomonas sp. AE3005]|uniref:tyrosine-type recombinase/integrase n=1 Tax=Selenomonas sp. AE3005 TaxID=1485543 RepID=UPI00047F2957|nr:site-specific integrase [Selenomonas sp. AE3005]